MKNFDHAIETEKEQSREQLEGSYVDREPGNRYLLRTSSLSDILQQHLMEIQNNEHSDDHRGTSANQDKRLFQRLDSSLEIAQQLQQWISPQGNQSNQKIHHKPLQKQPKAKKQKQHSAMDSSRLSHNIINTSVNYALQIVRHLKELDYAGVLQSSNKETQGTILRGFGPNQTQKDVDIDHLSPSYLIPIHETKNQNLKYIEHVQSRCSKAKYIHSSQLLKDIKKVFSMRHHECIIQSETAYLLLLWEKFEQYFMFRSQLLDRRASNEMIEKINQQGIVAELKLKKNETKHSYQGNLSQYIQEIEDYVFSEGHEDEVRQSLASGKIPFQCRTNCECFAEPESQQVRSEDQNVDECKQKCQNLLRNIECDHECTNQAIQSRQFLAIGAQLKEVPCWGLDVGQTRFIYETLPYPQPEIDAFIQLLIMRANAFNISCLVRLCTDYLLLKQEDSNPQSKMAKRLLRCLKHISVQEALCLQYKGFGIVYQEPKAIFKGTLIAPYMGEVYSIWRWFEKQECLRVKQKDTNIKEVQTEYYNYRLETHLDDPLGYDIIVYYNYITKFIDAIQKGNFISRMNHSCRPNCVTQTKVSQGKYYVGVYALRDIEPGEELTIDYAQDRQQPKKLIHKNVFAFVPTKIVGCNRSFLQNYFMKYTQLTFHLDLAFPYLQRTAVILQACSTKVECESSEPPLKLRSQNGQNAPLWLKDWTQRIVNQIYSQYIYIRHIIRPESLRPILIQNLSISLGKIHHYVSSINMTKPPLELMTSQKINQCFWKNWDNPIQQFTEQSIIQELTHIFRKYMHHPTVFLCLCVIQKTQQFIERLEETDTFLVTRLMLLVIQYLLLKDSTLEMLGCNFYGLAMILLFQAFTHTYFEPNHFQGFHSQPIKSEDLVIIGNEKPSKFCRKHYTKLYTPQYVWGEMIGWFKNHIANPQASMAQDRRGLLCYPSFIQSFDQGRVAFPWASRNISEYKTNILSKVGTWSPDVSCWSYKNSFNMFGTLFFELMISSDRLPNSLLSDILKFDNDFEFQFQYFINIEKCFGNANTSLLETYLDCVQIHKSIVERNHPPAAKLETVPEQPLIISSTRHTSKQNMKDQSYGNSNCKKQTKNQKYHKKILHELSEVSFASSISKPVVKKQKIECLIERGPTTGLVVEGDMVFEVDL